MKQITVNQFKELSENWLNGLRAEATKENTDQKVLAKNTFKQYTKSIEIFLDYLKNNHLQEINKETVLNFRLFLNGKFKPNTVNVRIVTLNKIFNDNNLKELTVNKVANKQGFALDGIMTEEELKKFIATCYQLGKDRLALLVETLVNTGIRIDELKFFTADKILDPDIYFFEVENKGKSRDVYLTEKLKDDLQEYCKDNDLWEDEVIFHGRDKHKLLGQATIWKELQKVAKEAGINKKFNAHTFRHIYAKRFVDKVEIDELANLLGHSSIETTRLYTKQTNEENHSDVENVLKLYN